jgi:DNA-binding transcriptional MerR regulator
MRKTEVDVAETNARKTEWNLAELAEDAGLSARTVRFYISRGLIPGPVKAGRGASYGPDHKKRLEEIRRLQSSGLTLAEIAAQGGEREALTLPEPVPYWLYKVADGVEVQVRADQSPWRMKQIRRALAELGRVLERPDEEPTTQGGDQ